MTNTVNEIRQLLDTLQSSVNMENLLAGDSFRPRRCYLRGWAEFTITAQLNDTGVGESPNVTPEACSDLMHLFGITEDDLAGFIDPDDCSDYKTAMQVYNSIVNNYHNTGQLDPVDDQTARILRRWAARIVTAVRNMGEDPGHDAKELHTAITLAAMLNDISETETFELWTSNVRDAARKLVQALAA